MKASEVYERDFGPIPMFTGDPVGSLNPAAPVALRIALIREALEPHWATMGQLGGNFGRDLFTLLSELADQVQSQESRIQELEARVMA